MRIDRHLNLEIPVSDEEGEIVCWARHEPLPTDVFKLYWKILGQTMNALYVDGMGHFALRNAAYMLQDIAEKLGIWADNDEKNFKGIKNTLMKELTRRTSIYMSRENGWELIPLYDVKKGKMIEEDQIEEIEAAIVFFTCGSRNHIRAHQQMVHGALALWSAQVNLRDSTEFMSFLKTSKLNAPTGEKPIP